MTRYTELVGVLNLTPDSFSDGGQYFVLKTHSYLAPVFA